MKIKEVNIGLSGVIPVASYQNLRPSYSMTVELQDGDDPEKVFTLARNKLRNMFESEANRAKADLIEKQYSNIRFYDKGDKRYPSVTSITGFDIDWSVTADELMQYASRGTIVHKIIEIYLKERKWVDPRDVKELEDDIKIVLGGSRKLTWKNCSYQIAVEKLCEDLNIINIEQTVYNDQHLYAGRLDLYGEYKGIPSVIDFKTGATTDMRQLAAYAACLPNIKQLIIVPVGKTDNKSGYKKPIISTMIETEFKSFLAQRLKFRKRFGI